MSKASQSNMNVGQMLSATQHYMNQGDGGGDGSGGGAGLQGYTSNTPWPGALQGGFTEMIDTIIHKCEFARTFTLGMTSINPEIFPHVFQVGVGMKLDNAALFSAARLPKSVISTITAPQKGH